MNRVIGTEKGYKELLEMLNELDYEEFPIMLERDNPMDLTMQEIKEFMDAFKRDSNLDISFHLKTCDDCGKLHMSIVIDVREEYEYGNLHLVQ